MKEIRIFGYSWFYCTETKTLFENEDKTGDSFTISYKHLTRGERMKIKQEFLRHGIEHSVYPV